MTEGYVDSYYARTLAEDRPRPPRAVSQFEI